MPAQTMVISRPVYYAQGDTAPALRVIFTNQGVFVSEVPASVLVRDDYAPLDLAPATATIRIAYSRYSYYYSPTRAIVEDYPLDAVDPSAGVMEYNPAPGHLEPPGEYQYTFEVTYADDTRQTFPSHTYLPLIINTRVGGQPGSPGNP